MELLDGRLQWPVSCCLQGLQEAGTGCSALGPGLAPGGSAGEAPFVYRGKKKILGCLATSGQARKGREAVSHFWAGFLAVLTHCDLKQFLSLLSPPSIHPSRGAVTLSLATWLSSAVGESSLSWSLLVLGARLDGWCPSPAHQCNLCPCSE